MGIFRIILGKRTKHLSHVALQVRDNRSTGLSIIRKRLESALATSYKIDGHYAISEFLQDLKSLNFKTGFYGLKKS